MAIDEAIADATIRGEAPPTLRFYEWEPPCLSLGHSQPFADVHARRSAAAGYDIVRRITGGRAILHVDELTYSIAGPADVPQLSGGVLEVYHRLSAGLLDGLLRLSVPADVTPGHNRTTGAGSPACFDAPSAHELTVGERKLIGSAQCRRAGWLLQHGSLPMRGDVARIVDVLSFATESEREGLRAALRGRATTIAEVLGREVSASVAAQALADGFAAALDILLIPGSLSAWELSRAAELREEKYAAGGWTERR